MLKSFSIERFRLFRSLEVSSLGQVNLLVGKNNSGKSAFLEAVQLFAEGPSPHLLWELVTEREETWSGRIEIIGNEEVGSPIRHLFHEHQLPGLGEQGIALGSERDEGEIHIYTAAYRRLHGEEEDVLRLARLEPEGVEISDPEVEVYLVAENGGRTRRLMKLAESSRRPRVARMPVPKKVRAVPTRSLPTHEVADLWDLISLTPLEEEVLAGLKLIDESIEDVAFVEDRGRGSRMPLVRTSKFEEPVPLNSMGDGVSRLFQIVLALANVKDGILLVDEFENGLHWTIQPRVWDTVFRLAAKLNVQVFATTHSRDCVEAFHTAWQVNPDSGAFFRLSLDDQGEVRPVAYDLETLGDAVETRVEVR